MLFKTRCSIKNEHCHHTQQNQPEKLPFTEHSGHYNLLNDKSILAQKFWHRHHFIWEARDRAASHQHKCTGQFYLSIMWKLIICFLTEGKGKVLWQDRKVMSPGVTLSYLQPYNRAYHFSRFILNSQDPRKGVIYVCSFFPVHIPQSCSPKKAVLYPAYFALLLAQARLHTLSPTHGPEWPHSLQMPYIIKTHILNLII